MKYPWLQRFRRYIHPAMRPLLIGRRRRFHVKKSLGLKTRNKILYYHPLPRVFPYFCKACKLNSRFLWVVLEHACTGKDESKHIVSFDNEIRIAQLGIRSRAKDAQAVMERVPHPQRINLRFSMLQGEEPTFTRTITVPSLIELATKAVEKMFASCHQTENGKIDVSMDTAEMEDITNDELDSNGENHFDCAFHDRICTACHADGFHTDSDFHEHILACASRLVKIGFDAAPAPIKC